MKPQCADCKRLKQSGDLGWRTGVTVETSVDVPLVYSEYALCPQCARRRMKQTTGVLRWSPTARIPALRPEEV